MEATVAPWPEKSRTRRSCGGEGTRKLGFRREKFQEQDRALAKSPRGYPSSGRSRERRATQTVDGPSCTDSAARRERKNTVERKRRG